MISCSAFLLPNSFGSEGEKKQSPVIVQEVSFTLMLIPVFRQVQSIFSSAISKWHLPRSEIQPYAAGQHKTYASLKSCTGLRASLSLQPRWYWLTVEIIFLSTQLQPFAWKTKMHISIYQNATAIGATKMHSLHKMKSPRFSYT